MEHPHPYNEAPEEPEGIRLRPQTNVQLAQLYGVHPKTFHRWLEPFKEQIGERTGYYYSINQVRIILKCLGLPGGIMRD